MAMYSTSNSSTDCLINKVPVEILAEIFQHCLPRYPLKFRQADTTIAPMLLCQVCSYWRNLALAWPWLWTHLHCRFIVDYGGPPLGIVGHKKRFEFFSWWMKNQGSVAPILYLDVRLPMHGESRDLMVSIESEQTISFFKHVASAQYVQMDDYFWSRILNQDIFQDQHASAYPNPRTLVHRGGLRYEEGSFYRVQRLTANYPTSSLWRLAIYNDAVPDEFVISTHWSALTHISFTTVSIALSTWCSLIRAVPALQMGYFDLFEIYAMYGASERERCTLSHLSALSVYIRDACPMRLLFSNLFLPALQTLSLSCIKRVWHKNSDVSELYAVLQSTPAITILELSNLLFTENGLGPIWKQATHLAHLKLDLDLSDEDVLYDQSRDELVAELDDLVHISFFLDGGWLDLTNPLCPVQKIALQEQFLFPSSYSDLIRDSTMASIRKRAEKARNVVFELVSGTVERRQAAQMWMEWGSRT